MSNSNHERHAEKVSLAPLDDQDGDQATPPETRILTIANVAEMFGVSPLKLRYYEFRGLVERRNRIEHQWVYSWADCERLTLIIKCRKIGVRLGDIALIIKAADEDTPKEATMIGQERCMALVDRLEQQRQELAAALEELSHLHAVLSTKIFGDSEPKRD